MKRTGFPAALALTALLTLGCSEKEETDSPVTGLVLSKEKLEMVRGEVVRLKAVLLPQTTSEKIVWTSSDGQIAVVAQDGTVTAHDLGSVTISALCRNIKAECTVEVIATPEAKVGDWYYSDGTYSAELKPDKTCLGKVFHVGHHKNDQSDYSATGIGSVKCHGYVVAAADADEDACEWGGYGYEIGNYPLTSTGERIDNFSGNSGDTDWNGYLYTEKIKLYGGAGTQPDEVVALAYPAFQRVMTYEAEHPAPGNSSGWFLPAVSQLWAMHESTRKETETVFAPYREGWYWSSSELFMAPESAIVCLDVEKNAVGYRGKHESIACVRPILAF